VQAKRKPYTLQVSHAVCESDLPAHLRHLLLTLALLAKSDTGSAHYGQIAIAKAMGCSDKSLRKYFRELEALDRRGKTPVRVVRKHRGTPDGGRTSDEWTLVLAEAGTSNGTQLPFDSALAGHPQTEKTDDSNGKSRRLKRNTALRGSSEDRRSDRRTPEADLITSGNPGLAATDPKLIRHTAETAFVTAGFALANARR